MYYRKCQDQIPHFVRNSYYIYEHNQDFSLKAFEIIWMVEGVVRQQPPIILAPKSRHLVAFNPKASSWKHLDGCLKQIGKHIWLTYGTLQLMDISVCAWAHMHWMCMCVWKRERGRERSNLLAISWLYHPIPPHY